MAALHPQLAEMVDAAALFEAASPEEFRAMRDDYVQTAIALGGALEPVARVEDVVIARPDGAAALPARAYWPTAVDPVGALVWLHGGGWCIGDLDGFDRVCRSLAQRGGRDRASSVDYRLAPEHLYPAAVDDADLAVAWATGARRRAARLRPGARRVGGDSAGGNLAAVASLHATGACAPSCSSTRSSTRAWTPASYREHGDFPLLTAEAVAFCWRHLPRRRRLRAATEPDASPLRAATSGVRRRPTSRSPGTTCCATTASPTRARSRPPASR